MNVTISIDDQLLRRARDLARQRGESLQQMIRGYLESLVGHRDPSEVAQELLRLMEEEGGRSGGRRIAREEAYEERL